MQHLLIIRIRNVVLSAISKFLCRLIKDFLRWIPLVIRMKISRLGSGSVLSLLRADANTLYQHHNRQHQAADIAFEHISFTHMFPLSKHLEFLEIFVFSHYYSAGITYMIPICPSKEGAKMCSRSFSVTGPSHEACRCAATICTTLESSA